MVFVAWQHPRVAELSGTRGDPFEGRHAAKSTSQKANRTHDPQSASDRNLPVTHDLGRLRSRSDCGNAGAGRLGRRWTARRRGETWRKTKHAAGQDEKDGDLATGRSGGNRRLGVGGPRGAAAKPRKTKH